MPGRNWNEKQDRAVSSITTLGLATVQFCGRGLAGILLPETMRVHQRDENGNACVWTATVYIEDKGFHERMEALKDEHGLTDTEAYQHALREEYQLDE